MSDYIGITENRLRHILGVARKAAQLAQTMGYDEEFSRKMFLIGWLHDVGYEYSQDQYDHPAESVMLLYKTFGAGVTGTNAFEAIRDHGKHSNKETDEWLILNMADMLIDSDGREVEASERLEGIKERYGEHSDQYLTACDICYQIGLTATNLAKSII